jgi:hypothetical protein
MEIQPGRLANRVPWRVLERVVDLPEPDTHYEDVQGVRGRLPALGTSHALIRSGSCRNRSNGLQNQGLASSRDTRKCQERKRTVRV